MAGNYSVIVDDRRIIVNTPITASIVYAAGRVTDSVAGREALTSDKIVEAALGGLRAVTIYAGAYKYADPSEALSVVGITRGATAAGGVVSVCTSGMLDGFTGLIPSGVIYLAAGGIITQVVPTTGIMHRLGQAITASQINIVISPFIILG